MHENTIISEMLYLARVMITEKNLHDSSESDCPKTGVDYMVTIYFIIVRKGRKATGNSDKNRLFQSE